MDALTPASAAAGASGGAALTAPSPLPAPAAPTQAQARPPVDPLPALPAAVQRVHLEPPQAKLMTREEMLSLLRLAV